MVSLEQINEVKEKLIREKAVYDTNKQRTETAIQELETYISKLSDEDIALLSNLGVSAEFVKSLDLQRLKEDEEYLENIKNMLEVTTDQAYQKLVALIS